MKRIGFDLGEVEQHSWASSGFAQKKINLDVSWALETMCSKAADCWGHFVWDWG